MSALETLGGLQVKRLYEAKSQINSLFNRYRQEEDYCKLINFSFGKVHRYYKYRLSPEERGQIKDTALWRAITNYDENAGSSFRTYLVNSVRYEYLNYGKGRIQSDSAIIDIDMTESTPSHEHNMDIADLVNNLPAKLKTVVRMRYYEKRTLKEISTSLNCSNEWVRQLLIEALDKMRRNAV